MGSPSQDETLLAEAGGFPVHSTVCHRRQGVLAQNRAQANEVAHICFWLWAVWFLSMNSALLRAVDLLWALTLLKKDKATK